MRRIVIATLIIGSVGLAATAAWVIETPAGRSPAPTSAATPPSKASGLPPRRQSARAQWAATRRSSSLADERRVVELEVEQEVDRDEPVTEANLPSDEQRETALLSSLEQQGRDPEWGRSIEDVLADAFALESFEGASLGEVDCRTTLCRVKIDTTDEMALDRVLETIPQTPPFATNGLIQRTGTPEAPQLAVFFAREGHRLPGEGVGTNARDEP